MGANVANSPLLRSSPSSTDSTMVLLGDIRITTSTERGTCARLVNAWAPAAAAIRDAVCVDAS